MQLGYNDSYDMSGSSSLFKQDKKGEPFFDFIDLFAGVGGIRLGFEAAGGNCVFSSEWDRDAQRTYFANFAEIPYGDITSEEVKAHIPKFDVLTGGFPCQPFSSIGKRQGFKHKTQGNLFYHIVEILENKKPTAFLLENVPGLKTHDGGDTYKTVRKILDQIGYEVFDDVLNASNFGVPQQRKRIYFVGFKRSAFKKAIEFNLPQSNGKRDVYINKFLESNVENHSISKHLQKGYLYKLDDGRPVVVDKDSRIHVKTLVSTYHKIQRLTGTFVADGPTGMRLFTANECKAIMGFPKNFIIPVSRTQMYRQMGNSVVVPVIAEIAKNIVEVLKEAKEPAKIKINGQAKQGKKKLEYVTYSG